MMNRKFARDEGADVYSVSCPVDAIKEKDGLQLVQLGIDYGE